jgi:hypothetical protein
VKDVTLLIISVKVEISRNFVLPMVKKDVVKMEKLLRHVAMKHSLMVASISIQLMVQIVKILNQELNALNGLRKVIEELNA